MATFVNIKIQEKDYWMLKLSNTDDVFEYMKFFAGRAWAGAKTCIERIRSIGEISHLSDSEAIVLRIIAEKEADEDGKFMFKPIEHSAKLIGMKYDLILKLLEECGDVVVNERGGLCDLRSFLDAHEAVVEKEIESDKIVFPKETDKSKTYKAIILENDNEIDFRVRDVTTEYNYKIVNKLKLQTKEQIMFYLETCEEVITKTTFLNEEQSLSFLSMFSRLEGKTIKIISDFTHKFLDKIKSDEKMSALYDKILSNNKIIFYNNSLEIINL